MKKTVLIAAILVCAAATRSGAEGLQSLIAAGQSMAEAKKVLAAEDSRFAGIKRALGSGALVKGQSKSAIRAQYGDPVVANTDFVTGRERWVYKSAGASFFKGPRVYLFFDKQGVLDETKALNQAIY